MPGAGGVVGTVLVMRSLFALPPRAISLQVLTEALNDAGDEDERWEAKGGKLHAGSVAKAVAGLANRDGGLLLLGVERSSGVWTVAGAEPPGDELSVWVQKAVRSNLSPPPDVEVHTIHLADGRLAGIVRVEALNNVLAVTGQGIVYYRDQGQTRRVTDGAEMLRLAARHASGGGAGPSPPGSL